MKQFYFALNIYSSLLQNLQLMKRKISSVLICSCAFFYVISCQKTAGTSSDAQSLAASIASLQAIAVGSTSSSASSSDSIYVIHTCSPQSTKSSIEFNSLPEIITDYLEAIYAGYTATQAYAVTDSSGAPDG